MPDKWFDINRVNFNKCLDSDIITLQHTESPLFSRRYGRRYKSIFPPDYVNLAEMP